MAARLPAIDADPAAKAHWDAFSPSQRREYCEWMGEAKREATAATWIAQTIEWVAAGKKRPCC